MDLEDSATKHHLHLASLLNLLATTNTSRDPENPINLHILNVTSPFDINTVLKVQN